VDVATGSLGQGLGFACGMAYAGKHFDKSDYRVYCVLGDGEFDEKFLFSIESTSLLCR
jgi:transketolase